MVRVFNDCANIYVFHKIVYTKFQMILDGKCTQWLSKDLSVCDKMMCTQRILGGKCTQWLCKDQSVSQDGV